MGEPNQDSIIKRWISDNSWNLLVTAITIIIAFTYLKVEVKNNTDKIRAVEEKINTYPSQDWFELKFKGIDDSIGKLTIKVEDHIEESK